MARLIDGNALIAWIKGSQQMTSKMKNIICYIKTMPTVDAVSDWIPCSERLPNNDEEVIVSVEDDRADNIFKYTTTAWRYGDVWVSDNERICGVIAWMPLPKPYEETDHE